MHWQKLKCFITIVQRRCYWFLSKEMNTKMNRHMICKHAETKISWRGKIGRTKLILKRLLDAHPRAKHWKCKLCSLKLPWFLNFTSIPKNTKDLRLVLSIYFNLKKKRKKHENWFFFPVRLLLFCLCTSGFCVILVMTRYDRLAKTKQVWIFDFMGVGTRLLI